ncbi:MAG: hypothetical protein O7A03_01705, partial [Alphaproteobacteria bacterium]|nr:hypothetical protein [Alphaproteobacteria bacterium]
ALAGPAFVAIHANGGLEKFDALKISFPSGNERFTSDALHRGASDELVIPVDFLRLLRNANDAAIEVQRAVDCNIGVVPGPLRGDCDGAERLERFLDQVSHAASNDLRRGSRDVIAPLIRFDSAFAIERDETEYSVSLNPAAVRGFNFASSLAVVVAHELGHIFAASGFDIGPDGRPGDIERKVDGFATRLLLETDGGVLNFSITSVRAAMLTLEVGGLATFDCQAAVFGAVQNDGLSQACRLE